MKNNIRTGLLFISIFYVVSVCFLMIMNICLSTSKVELHDSDDNIEKLSLLKQEALLLESNSCTDIINKMINYYEDTSYDGYVNLKEMYDMEYLKDDVGFLKYYVDLKEHCGVTEEDNDKYDFPNLVITSTIQREDLYQKYLYQYELGFKDLYFRLIAEPNLNNTEYLIRKRAELKIISNTIEMIKERGSLSE